MEYEEHERNYGHNQKDPDEQKSPRLVELLRHPVTDYLRSVARSRDPYCDSLSASRSQRYSLESRVGLPRNPAAILPTNALRERLID